MFTQLVMYYYKILPKTSTNLFVFIYDAYQTLNRSDKLINYQKGIQSTKIDVPVQTDPTS